MSRKHSKLASALMISSSVLGATGSDTISFYTSEASSTGQELRLNVPGMDDTLKQEMREIYERNLRENLKLFKSLREEWFMETAFSSDRTEIILSKPYQRIIGMGENALPFIFGVLGQKRENWFWALEAITGENPVPKEDYMNFDAAVDDWLEWGRKNGYKC